MAIYIDRHLTETIVAAGDSGQVEAIIIAQGSGEPFLLEDDGGLAQQVVDGAVNRTGDLPYKIRYFPRANAAVLSANGRLIQEILKDERLVVASAADLDAFPFSKL